MPRKVNLAQLRDEFRASGLRIRGVLTSDVEPDGTEDVYAIDVAGEPIELVAGEPIELVPAAQAILDAHVPVIPHKNHKPVKRKVRRKAKRKS